MFMPQKSHEIVLTPTKTWVQFELSFVAGTSQQTASVAAGPLLRLMLNAENRERHVFFIAEDSEVLACRAKT